MSFLKRLIRRLLETPLGEGVRNRLAAPAMRWAIRSQSLPALLTMCLMNRFLTNGWQVRALVRAIRRHPSCRLLIFGFGNDSPFYAAINRGGPTAFIEDNEEWFRAITKKYPELEAHRVSYKTRVSQSREYLENPAAFATEMPAAIVDQKWDVIFVDAPAGFMDDQPGRMDSIRLGAELAHPGADVFVHDCEREIERRFSHHFLGEKNLVEEVGNLRHYVIP